MGDCVPEVSLEVQGTPLPLHGLTDNAYTFEPLRTLCPIASASVDLEVTGLAAGGVIGGKLLYGIDTDVVDPVTVTLWSSATNVLCLGQSFAPSFADTVTGGLLNLLTSCPPSGAFAPE